MRRKYEELRSATLVQFFLAQQRTLILGIVSSVSKRAEGGGSSMVVALANQDFCSNKHDEETEATAVGSLEGGSSIFSGGTYRGADMNWAVVANGTRYVGHSRVKGDSSLLETADSKEDGSELMGETTSARNRRLLAQERAARAGRKSNRKTTRAVRSFNQIQRRQTAQVDRSVGVRASTTVKPKDDELIRGSLREVRTVLRRKVRQSRNTRRFSRPQRTKIKVRRPSVRPTMFGHRELVMREFSYTIRLFASSAVRYAMFRSNRRFKPGD